MISLLTFWWRLHILPDIVKPKPTWILRLVVEIWWNNIVLGLLMVLLYITKHLISPLLHYISNGTIVIVCTACATTFSSESSKLTTSLELRRMIF